MLIIKPEIRMSINAIIYSKYYSNNRISKLFTLSCQGASSHNHSLKKMSIDPAIASSVFVTTITDVIGFVSFLGVGAYFL